MSFEQDLFKRALDFAAGSHGPQTVPGSGFPYVVHVTKVAMEVIAATEGESSSDRNLAVACALLHDTVEDAQEEAREEVASRIMASFGPAVAAGVLALTKDERLPKGLQMASSLRAIKEQPRSVWLVKLADRITNLEPPPAAWSLEKRRAYLDEAKTILDALGSASAMLRKRFEAKLAEYEPYCR
jgi:(p)ppGpp synthase/HD superfamily hydrolase